VGEEAQVRESVLAATLPHLPTKVPRYLMGVGKPEDIVAAVQRGIDMFDCVLPTRNARNDHLFTRHGDLRLRNARFREDMAPIDADCTCYTCRRPNVAKFSAHGSTLSIISFTTRSSCKGFGPPYEVKPWTVSWLNFTGPEAPRAAESVA